MPSAKPKAPSPAAPLPERWRYIREDKDWPKGAERLEGDAEKAFDRVWDWVNRGAFGKAMEAVAADPSLAVRSSPRGTLLSAAYTGKRHGLAIELIAKGAWGPLAPEKGSPPFQGHLDTLHSSIAEHMPDGASILAAAKALEASGRPSPAPEAWIPLAALKGRFDSAGELADRLEAKPGEAFWKAMQASNEGNERYGMLTKMVGFMTHTHADPCMRQGAWRLVERDPGSVPEALTHRLWRGAILQADMESIDRLIQLGLSPADWILKSGPPDAGASAELRSEACSPLALAAASPYQGAFDALRELPEAVESARATAQSPAFLASCSIQSLSTLARLGVPLGTVDKEGQNVLHHWAKLDAGSPRNGWVTMAKLRPELLLAKDRNGMTPEALQRSLLDPWPKKLAAFSALMAKSERTRIAADIDDAPQASQASKARL